METRLVEYHVPLRNSMIIAQLVLPADLRQDEADELTELLHDLVVPSQDRLTAPEDMTEDDSEAGHA